MADQWRPDTALVQALCSGTRRKKPRRMRRGAVLLAAVLAALLLATPVMAAGPFYSILYAVSPATAQYFAPVQRACENNGIRMEVEAAAIRGDTAELYVSLQDLEGDRIDGTTDLYDSYSIQSPYGSAATCSMVDYDAQTHKAMFLISITQWNGHRIEGSKITFSVREFLSHKQTWENVEIPIDLSALDAVPTQRVETTGGSGAAAPQDTETALVPGVPRQEFPVKGIDLTAIGYVNGELHVQMAVQNRLENDNHGSFYLRGRDGDNLGCDRGFYFQDEAGVDYYEEIFSIPQEEIGNYTLSGSFVTGGMLTQGNWRVTFPMENQV